MTTPNTTLRSNLDKLSPSAKKAKLGQTLDEIITQFNALKTRLANCLMGSAGLVIKAGASPIVKAGNAFTAMANGSVVFKAASTDMAALVGTLATTKAAAWAFYVDSAGTLTTSAKTADSVDAATAVALLPVVPTGKALIGYITVTNATGSNFVGGTTALDVANLTVAYVNAAALFGDAGITTLKELGAR